jgi:sulfur-oxidizing protein SoxY
MMIRRRFLQVLGALAALPPFRSFAQVTVPAEVDPDIQKLVKGAALRTGRVKLEMPLLAENGNAVPLRVTVESPMTARDHVKVLHLVSDRNPMRHMAAFHFGPHSGRAQLATRVRLAGSQTVSALAEMSDGSFWIDRWRVQVTLSACLDESDWNK